MIMSVRLCLSALHHTRKDERKVRLFFVCGGDKGSVHPFCKANGVRKFLRVTYYVQIIVRDAHIIAKQSLSFCYAKTWRK